MNLANDLDNVLFSESSVITESLRRPARIHTLRSKWNALVEWAATYLLDEPDPGKVGLIKKELAEYVEGMYGEENVTSLLTDPDEVDVLVNYHIDAMMPLDSMEDQLSPSQIAVEIKNVLDGVVKSLPVKPLEFDHVRPIGADSGVILVCGRHPAKINGHARGGVTGRMRDFNGPIRWEVRPNQSNRQDETGWSEPNANGHYDARRYARQTRLWQDIITIKSENVSSVEWL